MNCVGMTDTRKDATIRTLARDSQSTPFASLYEFEATPAGETVRFNDSWWAFLVENLGIVESFAEHHLALYLQARNPNVPGVLGKLPRRRLGSSRSPARSGDWCKVYSKRRSSLETL